MVNPAWQPNWLGNIGGGGASMPISMGGGLGGAAGAASGGWLGELGNTLMGKGGLPISMGLSILSGILGGFAEGARKKKIKKAFKSQQGAYQSKANQLFPELSQASFQYQNPELQHAIQAALGQRMGNMFPSWGMPSGMQAGAGTLQDAFNQLMVPPAQQQAPAPQRPQRPQQPMLGGRSPRMA